MANQPSRPGVVDTGELLIDEVSFQAAVTHSRAQAARIDALGEVLTKVSQRLHRVSHTPLTSWAQCSYSQCREARQVLYGG